MKNCWTCGAPVRDIHTGLICPTCAGNVILKDIRRGVNDNIDGQERGLQMIAAGLSAMPERLSDIEAGLLDVSGELANIASIIQGGFEELKWEAQQQTAVLRSIDEAVRRTSQTQAIEWREMAEQLRGRGCIDEAIQWFVRSLELYPLDFRTYVGLGMCYIRRGDFDKAEEVLRKSLPHAPTSAYAPSSKPKKIVLGQIYKGTVIAVNEYMAFVEVLPGEEGYVEIEDLADEPVSSVGDVCKVGDEIHVKCVEQDCKGHARLSRREAVREIRAMPQERVNTSAGLIDMSRTPRFDYRSLSCRLIGRIYACKGDYKRASEELGESIRISPGYADGNYDFALYCVQSGSRIGWEDALCRAIFDRPDFLNLATVERRFAPVRQDLATLLSSLKRKAAEWARHDISLAEIEFGKILTAAGDASVANKFVSRVKHIEELLSVANGHLTSQDYARVLEALQVANGATTEARNLAGEIHESITTSLEKKEKRLRDALLRIPSTIIFVFIAVVLCGLAGVFAGYFLTGRIGDYAIVGTKIGFVCGIILGIRDFWRTARGIDE